MKKRIFSLVAILVLASMIVSPVSAGANIRLAGGANNVVWDLGSLIAEATLVGLGNTDVNVVLTASGIPEITCTNNGTNDVPGQSSPRLTASGEQALSDDDPFRKNGKSPFAVETEDPVLTWSEAGCPNANWSARVDFIYWTEASITVTDAATGIVLLEQLYTCETTRDPDTVSCSAVQ